MATPCFSGALALSLHQGSQSATLLTPGPIALWPGGCPVHCGCLAGFLELSAHSKPSAPLPHCDNLHVCRCFRMAPGDSQPGLRATGLNEWWRSRPGRPEPNQNSAPCLPQVPKSPQST